MSASDTSAHATFGAGCFWGVERAFRGVDGVLDAEAGYTGGTVEHPSYWLVCSGATGHAEAVRLEFDPAHVSYEALLDVFWGLHDPTRPQLGRRARYRSTIFVHSAEQEHTARLSLAERAARSRQRVLTEIVPAGSFYRAEERHQRYLEKRGSVQSAASSRTTSRSGMTATTPEPYDLIVIGAGSAAREAAARAATEHGASVAVIERERWGGQCPNVACKPTKQYVAAAELLRDLRVVAGELGIEVTPPTFDLARLKARKDWLIGTQETWHARFADAGYETITGEARFADAHTVRVGERELTSEHILVATGSRTFIPPIPGLDEVPWVDHISALELTELPESLLVLGAGAVGLELAQAFARFGSEVTIVQSGPRIAPRSDADASAELAAALAEEGIEILTSARVTAVAHEANGLVATVSTGDGERTLRASTLLVASGRSPNVEELDLEAAGVAHDRHGIGVDERLRTNVPGIWASGDVTATIQLTPVAALQAQVAIADMFGDGSRTLDYELIPTAIFTDPELASVGLTETEATERGFDVDTVTYAAKDLLRPYYVDAPHGLLKLVFERGSRRLLGLHAVVRAGSELVQGYAVALKLGATVDDVALGHYVFPSYGEGIHYAAESVLTAAALGESGLA